MKPIVLCLLLALAGAYPIDDDEASGSGSGCGELVRFVDNEEVRIDLLNNDNCQRVLIDDGRVLIDTDKFKKHFCAATEIQDDDSTSGRLFLYDDFHVGITDPIYSAVDVLKYNRNRNLFDVYFVKLMTYPKESAVAFDTCTLDDSPRVYTFFQNANLIRRYRINEEGVFGVEDILVNNTRTMSCTRNRIFLASNDGNSIRIYDKNMRLRNEVNLFASTNKLPYALARVNSFSIKAGLGVLLDSNGLSYFKYDGESGENTTVCQFNYNRGCINSVHLNHEHSEDIIYLADNCTNKVKQYLHSSSNGFVFLHEYSFEHNITSIITNEENDLVVLTSEPRKLYVFNNFEECSGTEHSIADDKDIIWF